MPNESYRSLIAAFCALVGLEHSVDTVCSTGSVMCNDVAFTLMPAPDQADAISVFTDFGEVPQADALQACRRLLEINLLMPLQHGPRMGMDCDTGKVVFAFHYTGSSAERLLACLELAAQQAQQWRKTFFLDKEAGRQQWQALPTGAIQA